MDELFNIEDLFTISPFEDYQLGDLFTISPFEKYVNEQIRKKEIAVNIKRETESIRNKFDEMISYTNGITEWCMYWRKSYYTEHQKVLDLINENKFLKSKLN